MKIYFIGICGTGVGNLAILLKNEGHEVIGSEVSEKYFYPPISDLLKAHKIPVIMGFDPNEITPDLDLVIMGGAALIHDPKNPQVQKAKDLGLRLISYARGIGEFVSKSENIEIVGNHGKTTTTALVAHLMKEAGKDASYFLGGAAIGFDTTIYSGKDQWSVCEGDEYPSIDQEKGGKFLYHNAKHVLFTSADWDHKNIYKTEEEYLEVFSQLFRAIPSEGLITACSNGMKVEIPLEHAKKNKINLYTISLFKDASDGRTISEQEIEEDIKLQLKRWKKDYPKIYKNIENIYYVDNVDFIWRSTFTKFRVQKLNIKTGEKESLGMFETPIIGQIGVENSLAAIAKLHGLGFEIEALRKGVESFQGVQRKLEVIYDSDYKVINDHAHSPIKIKTALTSLRTKFPNSKIFVIFHVHQSGLKEEITFNQLKTAFNLADFVLIARVNPDISLENPIYGKDYKDLIKEGAAESRYLKQGNVYYAPVVTQMRSVLENNLSKNDVVVIMSSGDAREFIDLAKNLKIK